MSRALLINPWIHDFAAYDFWFRPMGLLYLASKLREWGYQVDFVDCLDRYNRRLLERKSRTSPSGKADGRGHFHKEEIPKPRILRDIPRRYNRFGLPPDLLLEQIAMLTEPDVILVSSSMTYWYPGVSETINVIRKAFPNAMTILGGAYATLLPTHARTHSGADYIVQGDSINMLGRILSKVTGRQIPQFTNRHFPSEGDSPAYDLLPNTSSMVIFTSWGCPFRCTYCASWRISGEFRQREPRRVVDEIEFLCREHRTRHFAFYDDALLFANESHFKPIVKGIIARGIRAVFHTPNAIHPRYIDSEVAALMREANFQTIRLGLETASPDVQRRTGAKVTNSEFLRALACLEKAGYRRRDLEVYAMMGLPSQASQEVRETVRFINAEGCTIRLVVYSPIPGTDEWERALNASDLPLASDPLWHNPSVYPVRNNNLTWGDSDDLKRLVAELNSSLTAP